MNLTFHDFLVEYAKFPIPVPSLVGTTSTDIIDFEVGLLCREWKALHAVRDNDLATKLCDALRTILAGTPLTEDSRNSLLPLFLNVGANGVVNRMWLRNLNEAHVSVILIPREFTLSLRDRARCF